LFKAVQPGALFVLYGFQLSLKPSDLLVGGSDLLVCVS
jgi:hypothetical protein